MEFKYLIRTIRNFLILFLTLNFLMSNSIAATQTKPIICKQAYALCTSAPCIPDPRHPDYAICSCDVENGDSVGYEACDKRVPKENQYNITQLISTFSFAQFNTKKSLTCPKGSPWTDCVDAPCTVNPTNHNQAICSCKIYHEQSFFTFGGNCNTNTCATGFWSGATPSTGTLLPNALFEKLNITKNPWPNSECPTTGT